MSGRIRIISAALSAAALLTLCSCGKSGTETTTAVWDNSPEAVEFSAQEETTWKSCEEPFSDAYKVRLMEIEEESGALTGAYIDKSGNPLAIESYTDENGYINFYVCKFADGRAIKLTLETKMKKFTVNNNLLIDKGSDMLVLRYYIDSETIRQIIYDFSGDEFTAVRDKNFGFDDTASMKEAVTAYKADAENLVSFSDAAVQTDVEKYIAENLGSPAK